MKLDLGAGPRSPDGFTPLGHAHATEIFPLAQFADDSVDEIRASHVLEHFAHGDVGKVLAEWVRVLKPGGRLKVAVPDFGKVAADYLAGKPQPTQGYVMGGQIDGDDFHRALFDERSLKIAMSEAGLVLLQSWRSELADDCAALPVSLNIEGRKPHVRRLVVRGVMSAPRLGFNDMWNCATRFLPAVGVQLRKVGGAYWGQALTLGLEQVLDEGCDYVLTLDYDSVFSAPMIAKLIQLAMVHPEADAIAPLQAGRFPGGPMLFGFEPPEGALKDHDGIHVPIEHYAADLVPITTAHFGLTLIRADKLRALPRPWLHAEPDPTGGWGEGRVDADIGFWHRWRAAGNSLMLAAGVAIGHLEVMVRWPDKAMRPMWQSAKDWEDGLAPPPSAWAHPIVVDGKEVKA